MTGHSLTEKHGIRDVSAVFNIHAKQTEQMTAKVFAALLAQELMAKFGGHPTTRPYFFGSMDNGQILLMQYQGDRGVRTGDEEYSWSVEYLMRLDVPERV